MVLALWFPKRRADLPPDEYAECGRQMRVLIQTIPGFLSVKTYTAADGETVTLARFESAEALDTWREHPEHRAAQQRGRDTCFDSYRGETYELLYASTLDREHGRRNLSSEALARLSAGISEDSG
ncbi:MAG TPA: antibiotic biosynthesis monooxygenase [Candidatus Limnocylindria bacterium]|nr:antibiotic biosynthesis monooxygenase [Candidatus Limnocylindria bacterium]